MKWILVLSVFFGAALSHAADQKVEVKPDIFLAPKAGVQNNENVQGIIRGTLPNTCFQIAEVQVERTAANAFTLHQFATESQDQNCAMGSSPRHVVNYQVIVNFGHLDAGFYKVSVATSKGLEVRTISVSESKAIGVGATAGRYAGISEAAAQSTLQHGQHLIVQYSGTLNNGCTMVDPELQITHSDDTYVIAPKMHHKLGMCAQVLIPFQRKVDLGVQQPGTYLIYVRTMSGQPIQKIVQVL